MATNIPPHNLGEVVDALQFLLGKRGPHPRRAARRGDRAGPRARLPDRRLHHGPGGIRQAYRTGRGSIVMRARSEIEARKGDRESIVITEIPYQGQQGRLIEKIAELAARSGSGASRTSATRATARHAIVVDVKRASRPRSS